MSRPDCIVHGFNAQGSIVSLAEAHTIRLFFDDGRTGRKVLNVTTLYRAVPSEMGQLVAMISQALDSAYFAGREDVQDNVCKALGAVRNTGR